MGIEYLGVPVPGTVLPMGYEPHQLQVIRTKFWGLLGESSIRGKIGGRPIFVPMILHDSASRFPTHESMVEYITLDLQIDLADDVGTLTTFDGNNQPIKTYADVELEGVAVAPNPGIIEDVAGLLGGGWIAADCLFRFYQLSPDA